VDYPKGQHLSSIYRVFTGEAAAEEEEEWRRQANEEKLPVEPPV
jgi:hypothetical protein